MKWIRTPRSCTTAQTEENNHIHGVQLANPFSFYQHGFAIKEQGQAARMFKDALVGHKGALNGNWPTVIILL